MSTLRPSIDLVPSEPRRRGLTTRYPRKWLRDISTSTSGGTTTTTTHGRCLPYCSFGGEADVLIGAGASVAWPLLQVTEDLLPECEWDFVPLGVCSVGCDLGSSGIVLQGYAMNHGHLLHSVDLKIKQAEHHLKRLHEMGKQLTAKKPYSADPEPDPASRSEPTTEPRSKSNPRTPLAPSSGIAPQLARSLDNLAHALAMRHTGEPLPFEHKIHTNQDGVESPGAQATRSSLGAMPPEPGH